MLKEQTYRSKKWLAAVRSIRRCASCGVFTDVQAAHRNESKGVGIKTDDCATAALCVHCHHELDNGNNLTRDEKRAEMDKCIVRTLIALARAGLLEVKSGK